MVMEAGDVAPMRSAKVVRGNCEFGFKAKNSKNGDRMMFLYLGHVDGLFMDTFNPEDVLRRLGWVPVSEIERKAEDL